MSARVCSFIENILWEWCGKARDREEDKGLKTGRHTSGNCQAIVRQQGPVSSLSHRMGIAHASMSGSMG